MNDRRATSIILILLLGVPATARGGEPLEPAFSIAAGVGNAMGWTGVQGDRYLRRGELSVFGGLGYVLGNGPDGNHPTGVACAVGVRAFKGGSKHRAFLEASISEVSREWWSIPGGIEQAHRYGPGIQLGYQMISRSGFTLVVSGGVGYAAGSEYVSKTAPILGLGFGYTKLRH